MAASLWTVTTTQLPGVQLQIEAAELERLTDLGVIESIVAVTASMKHVYITDGEEPDVPDGTVWFNRSIP